MSAATNHRDPPHDFLELSVVLTGYGQADLLGTGMVRPYYDEMVSIVGEAIVGELLGAAASSLRGAGSDAREREEAIRRTILDDAKLGPVARNVIKMWYLGNWYQLPRAWRDAYGAHARDIDHVVSAAAYQEGLVWRAIGSHPPGAKHPGFGTWSQPPPSKRSDPS
jgi:hypothetical protein